MQSELHLDDVYDIWYTSFWQTPLGYGILILLSLIACLIIFGIVWLIKRYKESPKERSIRQLRALAEQAKKGKPQKKIYQELTHIMKTYLQSMYDLPQGITDNEVLPLLVAQGYEKEHIHTVQNIFEAAQQIKFGVENESGTRVEQDIAVMRLFIEKPLKSKNQKAV